MQNLDQGQCPNSLCRREDRQLDELRVLAMYSGNVVSKVHRLKGIRGHEQMAGWGFGPFGAALSGLIAEMFPAPGSPRVVGNPANPSKAYDAVTELMKGISAAATFPASQHLDVDPPRRPTIRRQTDVPSLRDTSYSRRRYVATSELRQALTVTRPRKIAGRNVVIVDDLFVTGSTLDEVARALKNSGAAHVSAVAIARKVWWPR